MTMYAENTPDRFVLLKISHEDKSVIRILSSWYGGYLGGNAWLCSTPIKDVKRVSSNIFYITTESGSTYSINTNGIGMNSDASWWLKSQYKRIDEEKSSLTIEQISTVDDINNILSPFIELNGETVEAISDSYEGLVENADSVQEMLDTFTEEE